MSLNIMKGFCLSVWEKPHAKIYFCIVIIYDYDLDSVEVCMRAAHVQHI